MTWRELSFLAALSARAGLADIERLRDLYLNQLTALVARHTEN